MTSPELFALSQRPDCMLALFPDNRVTMPAPIHPGRPGWPQIDATPRNFRDLPATWYDCHEACQEIGLDDYRFSIRFKEEGQHIFYGKLYTGPSICWGSSNPTDRVEISGFGFLNPVAIYIGPGVWTNIHDTSSGVRANKVDGRFPRGADGWVDVIIERKGLDYKIWLNGELLYHGTGSAPRPYNGTVQKSSTQVEFESIKLENLTKAKVVWHYPALAEKYNLAKLENARTDRGVFESAGAGNWTLQTGATASNSTVIESGSAGVVVNPSRFNRTTGTYTAPNAHKLRALLAFDGALPDNEIYMIHKMLERSL